MNRALLLVICDFLLLSLLALANFDSPGEEDLEAQEVEEEIILPDTDQDLMEALKLSLEEERASRAELHDDLSLTQQALLEREESLAEREARLEALAAELERREAERLRMEEERRRMEEEKTSLAEKVTLAEESMETLSRERARQEEEARRAREQALAMERELRQQLSQLEESQRTLAVLEENQRRAEEANRRLSTELELSETEKRLIRENLDQARTEVVMAREERVRIQAHAEELARGVSQMAERSGELAQEVRRSQPKSAASIFTEFQENQVDSRFTANRSVLLGPINRREQPQTILVSDGHQTYAVFHLDRTGLGLRDIVDWERISGQLSANGDRMPITELTFLSIDPRIVVVPVPKATAEKFGKKVYPIAADPFRFSEVVLVNSGGKYYGESTYTIDSDHSRFLRLPTSIRNRLFGEFSPNTGDLVFSKTGELIGIMVNNEYCLLVDNFLPAGTLGFGIDLPPTSRTLDSMKQRVDRLPLRLRN